LIHTKITKQSISYSPQSAELWRVRIYSIYKSIGEGGDQPAGGGEDTHETTVNFLPAAREWMDQQPGMDGYLLLSMVLLAGVEKKVQKGTE
jgi:hypothetical protein